MRSAFLLLLALALALAGCNHGDDGSGSGGSPYAGGPSAGCPDCGPSVDDGSEADLPVAAAAAA